MIKPSEKWFVRFAGLNDTAQFVLMMPSARSGVLPNVDGLFRLTGTATLSTLLEITLDFAEQHSRAGRGSSTR
jgi:hypothetical protein